MADQRIVDELYQGYEKYISEIFLDGYGKSYMTYETIGDKWRQQVPYTPDAEKLLIAKSVLFMRILKHPYARDIRALEDLGMRMAKYLSVYKMRATELPDDRKIRDAIRNAAKKELQEALVIKNPYIHTLQKQKTEKQKMRKASWHKVQRIKRNEKRAEKRNARAMTSEIKNHIFTEWDYLKRQK